MENAADALKMAAAVLIFVLALSISINAFTEARQTSQIIVDNQDREYLSTYVNDNGATERIVGAETIIPSIYKAYKENYKIIFEGLDSELPNGIYQKNGKNIYKIDLEEETLSNDTQKEHFIKIILYGKTDENPENNIKTNMSQSLGISFINDNGIYEAINKNSFIETLGTYYQEDVRNENDKEETTSEVDGASTTPEANKTKKRVITYTKQ